MRQEMRTQPWYLKVFNKLDAAKTVIVVGASKVPAKACAEPEVKKMRAISKEKVFFLLKNMI
jgi:pyocin large subunit-like protein